MCLFFAPLCRPIFSLQERTYYTQGLVHLKSFKAFIGLMSFELASSEAFILRGQN
jgi:hypothetical protein